MYLVGVADGAPQTTKEFARLARDATLVPVIEIGHRGPAHAGVGVPGGRREAA